MKKAPLIGTIEAELVSISCQKMPNLNRQLLEYDQRLGNSKSSQHKQQLSISPALLEKVLNHPDRSILALVKGVIIRRLLYMKGNFALDDITEHNNHLDVELAKLSVEVEKDTKIKERYEPAALEISDNLLTFKELKDQLEKINSQNLELLHSFDIQLPEQSSSWVKHQQQYLTQLTTELAELHQLKFNDYELSLMSRFEPEYLEEVESKLKKLGVDLPKDHTAFTIAAYGAIMSALDRDLQNTAQLMPKLVKRLPVLKAEAKGYQELSNRYEEFYQQMIVGVEKASAEIKALAAKALAIKEQGVKILQSQPELRSESLPNKLEGMKLQL